MAWVFFCSLQICRHNTLFWHYCQSTALWKQYFPVPGNLWSSHYLSPMSCTLPTEQCGPSTNPDVFHVPGGTFHFDQHVCASRWEKIGIWGKEVSFSNHHGLCWVILSGASSEEWYQLKRKKKKKKKTNHPHTSGPFKVDQTAFCLWNVFLPVQCPIRDHDPKPWDWNSCLQRQPTLCLWSRWSFSC